jgi:hypothetical protein
MTDALINSSIIPFMRQSRFPKALVPSPADVELLINDPLPIIDLKNISVTSFCQGIHVSECQLTA